MQVIKEKLEIEESLKKRIMNLLKFQNIKGTLVNGNIISIPKTNLAYIEPHKLELENNNLNSYIRTILKAIKDFFRELLHIGSKEVKDATIEQTKDYYNNDDFEQDDIYHIAVDTDKEDELFEYADIDNYYSKNKDNNLEL